MDGDKTVEDGKVSARERVKSIASATKQMATTAAGAARQHATDAAGSVSGLVQRSAEQAKSKVIAVKDDMLDRLPGPARGKSVDLTALAPDAKLLYCQIIAGVALSDDVLDPGEAAHLELVAAMVGLDDAARSALLSDTAEAQHDSLATRSTADLAKDLHDSLDEGDREVVFASLVRDLVRMARADGQVSDDEQALVRSVAEFAFPEMADDVVSDAERVIDEEEAAVESDRDDVRKFVASLSPDDVKSGEWFAKLLAFALTAYTNKVDQQYFQEKYKGVPADAIVDQRIKMAARYAEIEGGLSAGAYTGALAATGGSMGAATPVTVTAATMTLVADLVFITRLQLLLAFDIAVLYRVPLDVSDPEDLWKLIRVAFTIKSGEVAREGVLKTVPVLVRPLIKRFYSKGVLAAAKGLPVVGKFLLQRNVVKIGIPVVGVPLAILVNRYTTLLAGRHARTVFRNEARLIEVAETLCERTRHPRLLLWVAWLVVMADGKISDDEALLMRHLVRLVGERHAVFDERLTNVVQLDADDVWRLLAAETGDLSDLVDAAKRVATADRDTNSREEAVIAAIQEHCK